MIRGFIRSRQDSSTQERGKESNSKLVVTQVSWSGRGVLFLWRIFYGLLTPFIRVVSICICFFLNGLALVPLKERPSVSGLVNVEELACPDILLFSPHHPSSIYGSAQLMRDNSKIQKTKRGPDRKTLCELCSMPTKVSHQYTDPNEEALPQYKAAQT